MQSTIHVYEVHPRKDKRGFNLISDAMPFGRLWYGDANAVGNAIGYAEHRSRSHDAVIHVYDEAGNVIETDEHKGDFKECNFWSRFRVTREFHQRFQRDVFLASGDRMKVTAAVPAWDAALASAEV